MSNLTIPLISNDAVDLGKKRLLEHELAELLHERPQSSLLHRWNELVMQATLSEQECVRRLVPILSSVGCRSAAVLSHFYYQTQKEALVGTFPDIGSPSGASAIQRDQER